MGVLMWDEWVDWWIEAGKLQIWDELGLACRGYGS
jgi:hypothetical protein